MTQTETLARIQARLDACDWAAAEPLCRSALGVFGNAALLHAMLGYVCQQTGRDEEALEHCADALGRDKACWLACRVQTLSRLALGRLKGAEESAEAELRLTPLDPGSFALRAEVAARIAGPAAAIAAYAAAPAALREKVTAGRLEAAIQRGLSLAAATDLSAIRSRLNTGDLAGAEALIRQSLERFPELGELYGLLAYCLQQQTRFEEAIAASAAATDMSPDDWLALLSRGLAERALGRLTAARAVFGHAALLHPSDDGVRLNLVETTLRTRGFEATRSVIAAIPPGARGDKLSRLWRTLLVDHGEREERPSGETEIVARIEPARGWAARHDIQIVEAGPVEEIPFAEPRIWGGPEPEPPILIRGFSPYVVELPNATIASRSSLVLTRDDCLLNDVGGDADYGAFVDWSYDKRVLAQSGRTVMIDKAGYEVAEIEGGAMLAGLASDAFGHWVPEYLSRLPWLEQHPAFRELPIIVDAEMPAPHFEYLQLVCDRPLLRLPPNTAFRCRRLLYAPPPLFFPVELVAGHDLPPQAQPALSPIGPAHASRTGVAPFAAAQPGRHRKAGAARPLVSGTAQSSMASAVERGSGRRVVGAARICDSLSRRLDPGAANRSLSGCRFHRRAQWVRSFQSDLCAEPCSDGHPFSRQNLQLGRLPGPNGGPRLSTSLGMQREGCFGRETCRLFRGSLVDHRGSRVLGRAVDRDRR